MIKLQPCLPPASSFLWTLKVFVSVRKCFAAFLNACICPSVSENRSERGKDGQTEKENLFLCAFALAQRAHRGLMGYVFMIPTSRVNVKAYWPQVEHFPRCFFPPLEQGLIAPLLFCSFTHTLTLSLSYCLCCPHSSGMVFRETCTTK